MEHTHTGGMEGVKIKFSLVLLPNSYTLTPNEITQPLNMYTLIPL